MLEKRFGRLVPKTIVRRLMGVETKIDEAVEQIAKSLPDAARVLDAGAGEGTYSERFRRQRYCGVDLGIGDSDWNYGGLDVRADLEALPFADGCFDAALNIVVLEHTRRPGRVLKELGRALAPGATLLLVAPQQWEVHQAPHDYFRFTRFGLEMLLAEAGFADFRIEPAGGYFSLLSRRLIGALNFFQGGARILLLPFAAALVAPAALLLPSLDFLDSKKDFTLAYVCFARKP